jgi:Protein of Unknown function (DUF2784)
MTARLAAEAVLLLHLAFIVFAVLGGWLALRWRWMPWLHLPAATWGVIVEWSGSICPLTYLENHFLRLAGESGYAGGFVERYLWPLIYPQDLTRQHQMAIGLLVLVMNLAAYAVVYARRQRRLRTTPATSTASSS